MPTLAQNLKYPFGPADVYSASGNTTLQLPATGSQAVTIANTMSFIDGITNPASGNRTITLSIDSLVPAGAQLLVEWSTTGTQTTTFGSGFLAPVHTGVAGKSFSQSFVYDGTQFVPAGSAVQLN